MFRFIINIRLQTPPDTPRTSSPASPAAQFSRLLRSLPDTPLTQPTGAWSIALLPRHSPARRPPWQRDSVRLPRQAKSSGCISLVLDDLDAQEKVSASSTHTPLRPHSRSVYAKPSTLAGCVQKKQGFPSLAESDRVDRYSRLPAPPLILYACI